MKNTSLIIANAGLGIASFFLFRTLAFAVFWENPQLIFLFPFVIFILFGSMNYFVLKEKTFKHWFIALFIFVGSIAICTIIGGLIYNIILE